MEDSAEAQLLDLGSGEIAGEEPGGREADSVGSGLDNLVSVSAASGIDSLSGPMI
jgi:hypothetical protein